MNKKQILVLGGTSFIGRRLTEMLLLQSGFEVTLLNRGKTNNSLFKSIKQISGDRETEDIRKLFDHKWDIIIDVSCYYPRGFSLLLNGLAHKPSHYVFISTCSVYDNDAYVEILRKEDAPLLKCNKEEYDNKELRTYGQRKAACENHLKDSGIPYTIFRPALVFGPYDPSDRLYFWLYCTKHLKELLLPEDGKRQLSLCYLDDLVNGILNSLQNGPKNLTYNAVSYEQMSIKKIVDSASHLLIKEIHPYTATKEFLESNEVEQWSGIPLWLSADHFTYANHAFNKLLKNKITPIDKALGITIDYFNDINWPTPTFGMSLTEYKDLLKKAKTNHL